MTERPEKIVFCCALGENRGPKLSSKVKGSEFVEGGYTHIYRWLKDESETEQIQDAKMFYAGTCFFIIVDEIDCMFDEFKEPLKFIISLMARANITHQIITYQAAAAKIEAGEIHSHAESLKRKN